MTLAQFSGLLITWLLMVLFIGTMAWFEFRRMRFNFNLIFSLLFLLTFFFGFPFTALLVFHFNVEVVSAGYLLQALISAGGFYAIYYVTYKTRFSRRRTSVTLGNWLVVSRLEAHVTWILLMLLALVSVAVFFMYNGLLIFRLTSYSQIFSSAVSAVALKRFAYFFIPAMLIVYFMHPGWQRWLLFLITTMSFGVLTYMIVGGTRANIIIAFAIFLFIGITRGWINLWMLLIAGVAGIAAMFWLALKRYDLDVSGAEAFYTFLYLTRDTFSPWENLALLLQHYQHIDFQGLAPIGRDFYVYIPSWLWPQRPNLVLNTANYFTWDVLNNNSGLAISPTLIGSLLVMGGFWFIFPGAIVVGCIIKWFDWLYQRARHSNNAGNSNYYKAVIIQSFCFGAIFNLIVLAREGLDSFVSRVVFFALIFGGCLLLAKLLVWWLDILGLIRLRGRNSSV